MDRDLRVATICAGNVAAALQEANRLLDNLKGATAHYQLLDVAQKIENLANVGDEAAAEVFKGLLKTFLEHYIVALQDRAVELIREGLQMDIRQHLRDMQEQRASAQSLSDRLSRELEEVQLLKAKLDNRLAEGGGNEGA